jgi:hypothetical protein
MTSRKTFSPWRTRLAIVATGFAALGAFTVAKASAALPAISVGDASIIEGNAGTKDMWFTVKLSQASAQQQQAVLHTFEYGFIPANVADYQQSQLVATFGPGVTSVVVAVPIKGDVTDEYDETFGLKVTSHSVMVSVADGTGVGTIKDDDAAPFLSINDVAKKEGTGGITPFVFTAKLSAPSGKLVKVNAVGQSASAHIPDDLTAGPATLSFSPGVTAVNYTAHVNGDSQFEATEYFRVLLDTPLNASIADNMGAGTITNDDFLVINPQDPKPPVDPQPNPQPPADNGNNGGGSNGGGSNGGGNVSTSGDAMNTGSAGGGTGEQALGPNAAADARPVHKSIDWMTAALLTLLGACALGLIVVTVMWSKNRRQA